MLRPKIFRSLHDLKYISNFINRSSSFAKGTEVAKASCFTDVYSISNRILGTGVSGEVLECFDKTGHRFAVKKQANNRKSRKKVSLHWHCAAASGENIFTVVDVISDNDHIWLVMELMEGGTVRHMKDNFV